MWLRAIDKHLLLEKMKETVLYAQITCIGLYRWFKGSFKVILTVGEFHFTHWPSKLICSSSVNQKKKKKQHHQKHEFLGFVCKDVALIEIKNNIKYERKRYLVKV